MTNECHPIQKIDKLYSERGAIFLETFLMAPVLIMFFLFCADFLAYTKSHTFLSQVARDAIIFFATVPGEPSIGTESNLFQGNYSESAQMCEAVGHESEPWCYHLATQIRALRTINADDKSLDLNTLEIDTLYNDSPGNETVSINIRADKRILFFFGSRTIETNAILRKIHL